MGLRILHTADWHLGHSLHGQSRDYEHGRFLDWLLRTLEQRQADALLIAGDIFDSANPPAAAQAMLYRFLVEAGRRLPGLQMVLVAGNHDSPARLEAPSPILETLNVRVVGAVRRDADGRLDTGPLVVPLRGPGGELEAWCAAVPFLRPADLRTALPPVPDPGDEEETALAGDQDPLVAGVQALYDEVIAALAGLRQPEQALIALGHCYMVGSRISDLSERRILGGNQHALPASLFPPSLTYAALGHLHLAQALGEHRHLRYSGSPIPLALDERDYPHQVVQVDLEGGALIALESLPVPRSVEILRFPARGAAPPEELAGLLAAHPFAPDLSPEEHPYLELVVRLDQPDPGLRQRIEALLEGRPVRLLKLTPAYPAKVAGFAAATPSQRLEEIKPEGVFREIYRQQFTADPPAPLLAAFHELLESLAEGEP